MLNPNPACPEALASHGAEAVSVQMVRRYPDGTQNPAFARAVAKEARSIQRRTKCSAEAAERQAYAILSFYAHQFRDVYAK